MGNRKLILLFVLALAGPATATHKCSELVKNLREFTCKQEDPALFDLENGYEVFPVTSNREELSDSALSLRANEAGSEEAKQRVAKRRALISKLESDYFLPVLGWDESKRGVVLEWSRVFTPLTPELVFSTYWADGNRLDGLSAIERIVKGALAVIDQDMVFARLEPATWGRMPDAQKLIKLVDYDGIVPAGTQLALDPNSPFVDPTFLPEGQKTAPVVEAINVYSFGIFLYMIVHNGQAPFKNSDDAYTGDLFIAEGVDTEIAFMIHGCLRSHRDERLTFQDLDEFVLTAQRNKKPTKLKERTKFWVYDKFPLEDRTWIQDNRIREFGADSPLAKLHRKEERLRHGTDRKRLILVLVAAGLLAAIVVTVVILIFCMGKEVRKLSADEVNVTEVPLN